MGVCGHERFKCAKWVYVVMKDLNVLNGCNQGRRGIAGGGGALADPLQKHLP
jgi:hypothetical protein